MTSPLLTLGQAAAMLDVGRTTLRRAIAEGRGPRVHTITKGGHTRYLLGDLLEYQAQVALFRARHRGREKLPPRRANAPHPPCQSTTASPTLDS